MTDFGWPDSAEELEALQHELASLHPPRWRPGERFRVAAAFAASAKGLVGAGAEGDRLWVGAVVLEAREGEPLERLVVRSHAGGPYLPGLLALREGRSLELAIAALERRPDVVLVDGTGRDHPRRAGIALHLGAVLEIPTIGVTVRPLVATPSEPPPERGSAVPVVLDGEGVGYALRTHGGVRPVYVHAAWRTDPDVARQVVMAVTGRFRTPEPIRLARRLARIARAEESGGHLDAIRERE